MVVGELVRIEVCLKDRVVRCKEASMYDIVLFTTGLCRARSATYITLRRREIT